MPIVQMPDGALVELPDNPTPEQLKMLQSVQTSPAKELVLETGRVADKAVRKGVTGLPGLLGDLALSGVRNVGDKTNDMAMGSPPAAALRFLTSMFGNPAAGTKFGDAQKQLETGLGDLPPISEPKTKTGQGVANVLEATIGTVAGGGAGTVGQKAVLGTGSGLGGEIMARLGGDHPLARLLGSLIGGGATGAAQARLPNADKLVKQATEHVTDADWKKAEAVKKVLEAQGIPHLNSQLLGPRSTLDDVVATASANPQVRPTLTTATNKAPDQAHAALQKWTNENLPTAGPNNRSEVLTDVQEIASKALKGISEKSNKAFEAAMPSTKLEYDPKRVANLRGELIKLAESERFGVTSDGGKAILKLADDLLDSAKSSLDTSKANQIYVKAYQKAEMDVSELPGVVKREGYVTNAHKINNLIKDLNNKINDPLNLDYKNLPAVDVKRIMKEGTPEFDAARQAKRAVVESELNPAKQGLVGQIAQMGGGVKEGKLTAKDQALGLVFNPTQPQGMAIREMAKTMGGDQVGELLREHINKTMQTVLKGDDKSPRKFVQALYENPAQKENIEAALEVTAQKYGNNPEAVKVGFRRLMEGLDSFKDLKMASGVSPATTAAQAGQNIVSQAAQPMSGTRRFFDAKTTAASYAKIADLVASKDGLAKLQAIAKQPDQAILQQMIAGMLITSQQDSK